MTGTIHSKAGTPNAGSDLAPDRGIYVGKSWPRPATPCDLVPRWEGEFHSFGDWVNFASKRLTVASDSNGSALRAICVDTLGRRCANGRDFQRAADEGTFPVRYFWDCWPCDSNSDRQAKTPQAAEGEASQSGAENTAHRPTPSGAPHE
jgi:hypothetical protein